MYESGIDIYSIQKLAGHNSHKTTAIYTHISDTTISRINFTNKYDKNIKNTKMSNTNQNLVNAQIEVNRAVQVSNLTEADYQKLKSFGSSVTSQKSALEFMRYKAEQAIIDLKLFLEETK